MAGHRDNVYLFSHVIQVLVLLLVTAHSQGQLCPPGVRTLSCSHITAHNWIGSALTGQCPETNDQIIVTSIGAMVGDTFSCGKFTVIITAIHTGPVMGTTSLISSISFTATSDLVGTEVVCEDAAETVIEAFTIRGVDAFPTDADDVDIVGPHTYVVTDMRTVIEIPVTSVADEVLELFPDAYISVSYSGSQPSCGGSSRVINNVAQVDISCLGETNVDFTAVLMDDPNCISNSTNLPSQSFPLIAEPDFEVTITMTSNSAEVSVSMSSAVPSVRVQDDSFGVMVTATTDNGCNVVASAPTTYTAALFSNLESNTNYNFVLQIVSNARDGTIIGIFSGTFKTFSPSNSGLSTAEAVGITVALYTIFTAGVLVIACYHIYKLKQLRKTPRY